MEQKEFQDFLKNKYHKELKHAQQRALHHQHVAKRLEWGLIICSVITTILVPLSSIVKEFSITPITILSSTSVTVIATIIKSLKTQEKRSFHQKLYKDLDNEYYLYKAKIGTYQHFKDKEALFVRRVLSLLAEANKKMPHSTLLSIDTKSLTQDTDKE